MKKLLCLIIAAAMLIAFAGCKGGKDPDNAAPTKAPSGNTPGSDPAEVSDLTGDTTPGKLYFGAFAVRYPGISALSLSGNRAGSTEFNSREPAREGIRFIFELNEWVEYKLVCEDLSGEMQVMVFTHRETGEYKHIDEDEALYRETVEITDAVEGSFCISPEQGDPGWYDILFTIDGYLVAITPIYMYQQGALESLTDAQLEALMK